MDSFKKVNKYGVESNYYVVATYMEEDHTYIIYTDFVLEWKGDMKLYAGVFEEEEVKDIPVEKEKQLVHDFKEEMNKYKKKKNLELQYDDLSFTMIGEDGKEIIQDITRVIPNSSNKEEPYVVFTDYSLDENDEFVTRFGRIVEDDGNFSVETQLENEEVQYIEEMLKDEIVRYVNDRVEENLNGQRRD